MTGSGSSTAEIILGTDHHMTDDHSPTAESTPNQLSLDPACGYCDDPVGLLALVGAHALYCSTSCLVFADDYPSEETADAEGGETR